MVYILRFYKSLKRYTFSKKEYFENFTQYVNSKVDFKLIEGYYDNFSEIGDYFKNENFYFQKFILIYIFI